jgi:2'-deoxynucleoside 5'-phosphate N-hydrolase
MNIYFACSIVGGRQDADLFRFIVEKFLEWGHQVPTEVFALNVAKADEIHMTAAEVFRRDVDWIEACDVLIAEVSTPSHGVGYEMGYALNLDKPVLCLHRKTVKISKMISGNPHPKLQIKTYQDQDQLEQILHTFLH